MTIRVLFPTCGLAISAPLRLNHIPRILFPRDVSQVKEEEEQIYSDAGESSEIDLREQPPPPLAS